MRWSSQLLTFCPAHNLLAEFFFSTSSLFSDSSLYVFHSKQKAGWNLGTTLLLLESSGPTSSQCQVRYSTQWQFDDGFKKFVCKRIKRVFLNTFIMLTTSRGCSIMIHECNFPIYISASPFMFGKSYRRLDFDGLTCSFIIQDVIPDSLSDSNGGFPFNVIAPYLVTLVYIPQLLPLILITCFTVGVVIELLNMNRRGSKSQKVAVRPQGEKERKQSWYEAAMVYLEKNREVKLSLIMLVTTIGFLICYGLWIFFMLLHLGMLMNLVQISILYSEDELQSNLYSKLFLIHEMVGFAHAAIEPMVLFFILVRPSSAAGCSPPTLTTNNSHPLNKSTRKFNC